MSEQLLIGLYSPVMQSGKSTVADYLIQKYGFVRVSFASALKNMVRTLLFSAGLSDEQVEYFMNGGKETAIDNLGGKSVRFLTQTIGTEWGRNLVSPSLWSDLVLKSSALPELVIIDDMRFPNEYDDIRAAGGQVWRISRPGTDPTNDHPSEGLLEGLEFDEEIINDGTVAELLLKADEALGAS